MASSVTNNDAVKSPKGKGRLPPPERFWKRYSRHHEFPLSVVSSIFAHLLVGGIVVLIVTGALLALLGLSRDSVPIEPIRVSGGAGNPLGEGTGPANAAPSHREAVEENDRNSTEAPAPKDVPDLTKPQKAPPPLLDEKKNQASRPVDLDSSAQNSRLDRLSTRLSGELQDVMPAKGEGGPRGEGGGKGTGKGGGEGNATGPGKQTGPLTQHQKRQNRWTLIFDTRDGLDYLRQLHGLGAVLAVPTSSEEYQVFRNLDHRPAQGRHEDISAMPGLRWYDTKPDSVRSLAMALELPGVPPHVVALFPPELEKRLRKLEERAYPGEEDNIDETLFRVVRRGGHYEVALDEVKSRR
jgi:hypothetical protein